MIKVINIISDTNIGGAGKCIINFCKNYDEKRFDLAVIVPKGSLLINEIKDTSARVIEVDGMKDKSWDFKSLFKLIKILRKEKPDIVHTHASSTARLAARFAGDLKVVFTRHSVFPVSDKIKHGIGRFIYKTTNEMLSDEIIAVAEAAKDNLTDGGIAPDKIEVILNGVERLTKNTEEQNKKLKEKYGIKDDEYVIGILARLEEVKGHEYFIDAAKLIIDSKKINAKFLILGTGNEEAKLKQKVKKMKLEDKIIFTGFVKNVKDFVNIFDLQVNCSYGTEATSMALLEGMSLGVPAVVTDYGGNPGVIKNGENGFIVPIKSPELTADAILKILTNEEILKHMQKKSLEIFEKKFTVQVYTKNIEDLYERLEGEEIVKKVNLLDILIILVVLIAGIFGYKYISKTDIVAKDTEKVVFRVMTRENKPEVFNMIEEGTTIYDSLKNYNIGTVTKKEMIPSTRVEIDMNTGEQKMVELNEKIDIIFTIEADATCNEKDITVGDYILKVGNEAYVKGKGYAGIGNVIQIER